MLEIGHPQQKGLSFRAIDSLGMDKKLITNYEFIEDYDFYNRNNIYILKDNNIEIPVKFFKNDYQEIDNKIKNNYKDKEWIKKMFFQIK